MNDQLNCNYCKAINVGNDFMIGAGPKSEWVLHEGTGKLSCPKCHSIGLAEATKVIEELK